MNLGPQSNLDSQSLRLKRRLLTLSYRSTIVSFRGAKNQFAFAPFRRFRIDELAWPEKHAQKLIGKHQVTEELSNQAPHLRLRNGAQHDFVFVKFRTQRYPPTTFSNEIT